MLTPANSVKIARKVPAKLPARLYKVSSSRVEIMYTGVMNEFSILRKSLPGDGSPKRTNSPALNADLAASDDYSFSHRVRMARRAGLG